jgi:hypothetical protein
MRRSIMCLWVLLLAGCGAQRELYRPTDDDRALLMQRAMPLSVAVIPWSEKEGQGRNAEAYGKPMAELLAKSGAFESVVWDPSGKAHADLIAVSMGDHCNTAVIPLLTIVTVGIIPTVWDETQCDGVHFRSPSDSAHRVRARTRYTSKAIMGWFAAPAGLLPGWSYHSGRGQHSYQQAFRVALMKQRAKLMALAGR